MTEFSAYACAGCAVRRSATRLRALFGMSGSSLLVCSFGACATGVVRGS